MTAEVYYSSVEQGQYGNIKKQWSKFKDIKCYFASGNVKNKEEQQVQNVAILFDTVLIGRVPSDIRFDDMNSGIPLTNLIITNILDGEGNPIYVETGGVRAGKSTLFEIATLSPYSGLFGKTEYYKIIIKRSDNQGTGL
jgi:hypothetical protein